MAKIPTFTSFFGIFMEQLIKAFPLQIREARQVALRANLRPVNGHIHHALLVGLGGSAFGGEILKNVLEASGTVPFSICREYSIPAWVGPQTLVIASSYSGNTEETLSSFDAARAAGARLVVITSGGELLRRAQEHGIDFIQVPPGYPPRAAAGFSIVQLIRIFTHFGLSQSLESDLDEAVTVLESFTDHNAAKDFAAKLKGRWPVIYSSGSFESAAIRWRQQIEENAKQIASHHIVPEMNHNELVGWKLPADILSRAAAIFLHSPLDHPRVATRMEINAGIISKCTDTVLHLEARGQSKLAQLLYLLHFGDWVSLYLAFENEIDPLPVDVIDYLKNTLAGSPK